MCNFIKYLLNEWRETSWKTSAVAQETKEAVLKQWETDIGGMINAVKQRIFFKLVSIQCHLSLLLMQIKETNSMVNSKLCKKSKLVY